jgi:hypothetical protein
MKIRQKVIEREVRFRKREKEIELEKEIDLVHQQQLFRQMCRHHVPSWNFSKII